MRDRRLPVLGHYLSSNIIHPVIEPSSRLQGKGWDAFILLHVDTKDLGYNSYEKKGRQVFIS